MRFYVALFIGCCLGFLTCAVFASTKIAKLERILAMKVKEKKK